MKNSKRKTRSAGKKLPVTGDYKRLREKVEELEKTSASNFEQIFYAIKMLIKEDKRPKQQMGFRVKG